MKDLGVALVGGGVMAAGCGVLMIAWWVVHDPVLLYSVVYGVLAIVGLAVFILACMALRWVMEAAMAYMQREQERSKTTASILVMTGGDGGGKPTGFLPGLQAVQPGRQEGYDVVDVIPGKSGQGAGTTVLGWPDEGGAV